MYLQKVLRNKNSLRHRICDGGGKNYRGSTPICRLLESVNPMPFNGGFPQNDTCRKAFPFCAHRVHFTVFEQVSFQLLPTSLVLGDIGYFSRSLHLKY